MTSRRRTSLKPKEAPLPARNGDYFDASEDDDPVYSNACSLGKFVLNPCYCLISTWRSKACFPCRRRRRGPARWKNSPRGLARRKSPHFGTNDAMIFFLPAFVVIVFPLLYWIMKPHQCLGRRPQSGCYIDSYPLVLGYLQGSLDVGGWLSGKTPFRSSLPPLEEEMETADYGGLVFGRLRMGQARQIHADDDRLLMTHRVSLFNRKEERVSLHYWHQDELIGEKVENPSCRSPTWKYGYYPTCNTFHELGLNRVSGPQFQKGFGEEEEYAQKYLSHGYYRDVWLLGKPEKDVGFVLKMTRLKKFDFNIKDQFATMRDALVMERLSASPSVVDIYGHCSTSILAEAIPNEVEIAVVPGTGYIQQEDLHDEEELKPQNNYTATEKLEIALAMAESLAYLHGFDGGVIVHDDVQLCQWLRTKDGKLKLGDFNRAEIMDWNDETQEYCKYNNGGGYGNYRAPEEFAARDLDEKIDVFSYGNNLYALLTGLWVFYENEDDEYVQKKLIGGSKAYVDYRYQHRSYAEAQLVELMERCWEYNPDKRIDIFEVVRFLRGVVEENERRNAVAVADPPQ